MEFPEPRKISIFQKEFPLEIFQVSLSSFFEKFSETSRRSIYNRFNQRRSERILESYPFRYHTSFVRFSETKLSRKKKENIDSSIRSRTPRSITKISITIRGAWTSAPGQNGEDRINRNRELLGGIAIPPFKGIVNLRRAAQNYLPQWKQAAATERGAAERPIQIATMTAMQIRPWLHPLNSRGFHA